MKYKLLLLFSLIVLTSLTVISFISTRNTEIVSPLASEPQVIQVLAVNDRQNIEIKLQKAVDEALLNSTGTYAVIIKDLETGAEYKREETKVFESASLYKLWIMAETIKRIEQGTLKEDDILAGDVKELNERFKIATEAAELQEGSVSMTVKDALSDMITVSHNYAALLLSAKIRLSNVTQFLKDNGFNASKIGEPPVTTAVDVSTFLEKVYRKELVSTQGSEYMTELLKKQEKNTKIPRLLPQTIQIAHKTGELGPYSHDAGIIYSQTGDYIIVILSKSNNPQGADERIAKISQNVYNVLSQK